MTALSAVIPVNTLIEMVDRAFGEGFDLPYPLLPVMDARPADWVGLEIDAGDSAGFVSVRLWEREPGFIPGPLTVVSEGRAFLAHVEDDLVSAAKRLRAALARALAAFAEAEAIAVNRDAHLFDAQKLAQLIGDGQSTTIDGWEYDVFRAQHISPAGRRYVIEPHKPGRQAVLNPDILVIPMETSAGKLVDVWYYSAPEYP